MGSQGENPAPLLICLQETLWTPRLRQACLPIILEGSTSLWASSSYSDSPLDPTAMGPHGEEDLNLGGC